MKNIEKQKKPNDKRIYTDDSTFFDKKLNELLRIGYLVTTKLFNNDDDQSDFNIVYSTVDTEKIKNIINGFEQRPNEYYSGRYVFAGQHITIGHISVNLIPVYPHIFAMISRK